MSNILLTGNLIFVRIDQNGTFAETTPLYMAGSVSGPLFGNSLYTYDAIKKKYPEAEELKGFLDIDKAYSS